MGGSSSPVIAWHLMEGKAGHSSQAAGLLEALARQISVDTYTLSVPCGGQSILAWGRGVFPAARELPNPDIIVGAGRATHVPLLAARRARGGRAIVLMRPGWPFSWYDLCLMPEHDGVAPAEHIVLTRGVLNRVSWGGAHHPARGLILVGGPSRHYHWDSCRVLQQIETIVQQARECQWRLSTSRRTPPAMLSSLRGLELSNLAIFSWDKTPAGWVAEQLALAGRVWVSGDSVSMVYEALTSGAAVGVLSVPRKGRSRVARGLENLVEEGLVAPFDAWYRGQPLQPPPQPFHEADRCAQLIVERWFAGR